jgi:hypothetical protein
MDYPNCVGGKPEVLRSMSIVAPLSLALALALALAEVDALRNGVDVGSVSQV